MNKIKSRVVQDSRKQSRIFAQIECRFESDEKEYDALMLDVSQGGALISSTFLPHEKNLPVEENDISVTIEYGGALKAPLTLKAKIRRSNIGMSEFGKVAQFGVEFDNTPLELLRLIAALQKPRPKEQAEKPAFNKLEVVSFD
jgi:hypothetical protein